MSQWPARRSVRALIVLAAALFAGVLLLWAAMRAGLLADTDAAILQGLRVAGRPGVPIGPNWFERLMRDVTVLGGGRMLTLLVLGVAGLFAIRRQWARAALLLVATYAGSAAETVIKGLVGRGRPVLVPHLVVETSPSFPSAHAANSSLVFLTIAALAVRHEPDRLTRRYAIGAAIVMTVLVGASRAYLGVHWPSDILAGWCLGAGWATLTMIVARHMLPRNARAG